MKKPGRNDPCSCGSGRKYKQCCMRDSGKSEELTPIADIGQQGSVKDLLPRAIAFHQGGKLDEAEAIYLQILALDANQPDALHYLGVIAHARGDYVVSTELIARAMLMRPNDAFAHCNMGNALLGLQRLDDALASYDRALQLAPDLVLALYNRGNVLLDQKRYAEALASYDSVLAKDSTIAQALCNRGNALLGLQLHQQAFDSFSRALAQEPRLTEAICNQGIALEAMNRLDEAIACYLKALQINPNFASAYNNLGSALQKQKRFEEAIACYRRSIELRPDYTEAYNNLGTALQEAGMLENAMSCYATALQLKPDYISAMANLGAALQQNKRFDDAAACYRAVLDLDPSHHYAFGMLANCALQVCDWETMQNLTPLIQARIKENKGVFMPFTLLAYPLTPTEQLTGTQRYLSDKLGGSIPANCSVKTHDHPKIHVAYLSADFYQHSTACLTARLFELHDRERFVVSGISFGPDDQSELRKRLIDAFDHFHDVRLQSDIEVAELLRTLEVDIVVDLKGYTQDARFGILAHRPAPIQVAYLGYPGSMGADFIDYVIADKHVLPFDEQATFAENIVHLPDCYQVNDSLRMPVVQRSSRDACGLPENGFVFCCFNNNYKITSEVFDVWMRLLRAVDGSVFWLLEDNQTARKNIMREADARGVAPERLIFASRVPMDEHLSRQRLADLFLDTVPVNAHTTASDALWADLPILTCKGNAFVGRVASSILHAVELPELVATNLREYESIALRLATDASYMQSIRVKLKANKERSALFDTKRFTGHLEAAYCTMFELAKKGEAPRSFAVPSERVEPKAL